MVVRGIVFIICTLGSLAGIILSVGFLWFSISDLNDENLNRFGVTNKSIGYFIFSFLCCVAWIFYSLISYYWIRYGTVNFGLKTWGFIFGVIPILITLGAGAVFTAPSIILMLYILLFVQNPKGKVVFSEGSPKLPQALRRR
tara:strand:+ start:139 stop:564 length:426 start_codon:yes stop_codon:yes gene_type:complete